MIGINNNRKKKTLGNPISKNVEKLIPKRVQYYYHYSNSSVFSAIARQCVQLYINQVLYDSFSKYFFPIVIGFR